MKVETIPGSTVVGVRMIEGFAPATRSRLLPPQVTGFAKAILLTAGRPLLRPSRSWLKWDHDQSPMVHDLGKFAAATASETLIQLRRVLQLVLGRALVWSDGPLRLRSISTCGVDVSLPSQPSTSTPAPVSFRIRSKNIRLAPSGSRRRCGR
jgi:hypothetical protein